MICDTLIEFGLLLLLIYSPLAFGAVTEYAFFLIVCAVAFMILIWLMGSFRRRHRLPPEETLRHSRRPYLFSLRTLPAGVPLFLLLGFFLIQLFPLPVDFVQQLSPQRYLLHAETAATLESSGPSRVALSVSPQATEAELSKFLVYLGIFFLAINTIRSPKQIRRFTLSILTIGFFEAFYGIVQKFVDRPLLPFYQPSSGVVRGTFIVRNHFAGYLEMAILLGFGCLFAGSLRQDFAPGERLARTLLLGSAIFLMIVAQFLSASRGGIVSLSIGVSVFLILAVSRRLLRRWGIALLVLLPLIGIAIALLVPVHLLTSLERFHEERLDPSFRVRSEIWRTQWHIFQDFPIFGAGFGSFPHLARRYQTFLWNMRLYYSESDLMQLLAEGGIIGVMLVCWAGIVYFYRILTMWKQRRSRWAIALVTGCVSALVSLTAHAAVDFNFHIPSNAILFTVIAALGYVTVHTREQRKESGP
ncbi:MAG: O-antigen ligase family protein [bacterium]|nr:O-antigen ligase family protein [bacterium]